MERELLLLCKDAIKYTNNVHEKHLNGIFEKQKIESSWIDKGGVRMVLIIIALTDWTQSKPEFRSKTPSDRKKDKHTENNMYMIDFFPKFRLALSSVWRKVVPPKLFVRISPVSTLKATTRNALSTSPPLPKNQPNQKSRKSLQRLRISILYTLSMFVMRGGKKYSYVNIEASIEAPSTKKRETTKIMLKSIDVHTEKECVCKALD